MTFTRTTALFALLFAGCATAPRAPAQRDSLRQSAEATLGEMIAHNPPIQDVIHKVPAYAVFPSIGKAGFLVGGAYGRGILYQDGIPTGYVSLEQASVGAQLGGQSFAELLVLRTANDIQALKEGRFAASADLGVVVLTAGAAKAASFDPDASVFVMPRGDLTVDISITEQQLNYSSFNA